MIKNIKLRSKIFDGDFIVWIRLVHLNCFSCFIFVTILTHNLFQIAGKIIGSSIQNKNK